MKKFSTFVLIILTLLVISACSKSTGEDVTTPDNSGSSGEQSPVEDAKNEASEDTTTLDKGEDTEEDSENTEASLKEPDMMDYFLPDSSKAHYEGVGNEYAELDVNVSHPYKDIVMVYENNGGSMVRKIYKVEKDRILKLDESPVDFEENAPPIAELKKLETKGVYLQKPFEVGASFEKWTIIDIDATVETPYRTFEHALVIEEKGNDFTNRKYFAEGFGEVKRESIMEMDGEDDFVVTSSVDSVTQP